MKPAKVKNIGSTFNKIKSLLLKKNSTKGNFKKSKSIHSKLLKSMFFNFNYSNNDYL